MNNDTEIEYLGQTLCDTNVLIAALGGPGHTKLFERLRYVLNIIPEPVLKINEGKGTKAYFVKEVADLVKDTRREREKGLRYNKIQEKLDPEIKQVFAKTAELKKQIELERKVRNQLTHMGFLVKKKNEATSGQPDIIIRDEKSNQMFIIETKIQEIENELKVYFKDWDKSIPMLSRIRQRIEERESLQARERIAKSIVETV